MKVLRKNIKITKKTLFRFKGSKIGMSNMVVPTTLADPTTVFATTINATMINP